MRVVPLYGRVNPVLTATVIPYSPATEDVMASGQQLEQSRVPGCILLNRTTNNSPDSVRCSSLAGRGRHFSYGLLPALIYGQVYAFRVWFAVGIPSEKARKAV